MHDETTAQRRIAGKLYAATERKVAVLDTAGMTLEAIRNLRVFLNALGVDSTIITAVGEGWLEDISRAEHIYRVLEEDR